MEPSLAALALLVFALVATRLEEERRWRSGRWSHDRAAVAVVARLPLLVGGFAILTGRDPAVIAGGVLVATGAALLLRPVVRRRLERIGRPGRPGR